jgi:hypothetical protein
VLGIPELAQPRRRADVREQALERHRQVVAAVEQPRPSRTARGRISINGTRPVR